MWKQVVLLVVVVFLTLGQSMESDPPDNINRPPYEMVFVNNVQTVFNEWKSTLSDDENPNDAWTDDEILENPNAAMQFVYHRFKDFGWSANVYIIEIDVY
eukprot:393634_1